MNKSVGRNDLPPKGVDVSRKFTGNYGAIPSTHWSLIARAGQEDTEVGRDALGRLLLRYIPALRAHLVHKMGIRPEKAEDLIQDFVANKVLEKGLIARADKSLGKKFRTYFLTALDRFVFNQLRNEKAQKRRPSGGSPIGIDNLPDPPSDEHRPSDVFDIAWAREVIAEALRRMRDECETSGRAEIWGVFECRILLPTLNGTRPVDYRKIVKRFGLKSPTQAGNVLITAKRIYARLLRSVIAEYAEDEQIDSEIADLKEILSRRSA